MLFRSQKASAVAGCRVRDLVQSEKRDCDCRELEKFSVAGVEHDLALDVGGIVAER